MMGRVHPASSKNPMEALAAFRKARLAAVFLAALSMIGVESIHALSSSPEELERYHALLKRHPFMPKSEAPPPPPVKLADPGSYKFTGFVTIGASVLVGIENVPQNKSYLLKPGQSEDGIGVKEVNIKERHVVMLANGETLRLNMVELSSGAPGGPGMAPPPPMQPGPPPPPGNTRIPRRRIIPPRS